MDLHREALVINGHTAGPALQAFPRDAWGYLGKGVLIEFERLGLVHYTEPEPTLALVARHGPKSSTSSAT